MTRVFSIKEDVMTRTFQSTVNGMTTDVKVVGVMLTDGRNTIYAEGYRERADSIEQMKLMKGDVVQVHLSITARTKTKDGVGYISNNVTIDSLQILVRNGF